MGFNLLTFPSYRKFPPKAALNPLSSCKAHLPPPGAAVALLTAGRESSRVVSAFPLCVRTGPRALYVGTLGVSFRPFIFIAGRRSVVGFCSLSDRKGDGAARMKLVR